VERQHGRWWRGRKQPKLLRVGTVAGNPKSAPQWIAFHQRMAELGYQEGKNFVLEFIQAANIGDYPSTSSQRF
jgi:hypothetical protein